MTNISQHAICGLDVPARTIPIPRSISPQAQAMLAHAPPVGGEETFPPLNDSAGWRAHAAAANAGIAAFTAQNLKRYPGHNTTIALPNCPFYEVVPNSVDPANNDSAILYLHGGGFFMGGGEAAIYSALPFAYRARMTVYSLDYRMPPDHPFPAAIEDAIDAYRWLLDRFEHEKIAVYGPSAGGNLAPAVILKARELGLPLPAVCAVHSPAADLTESGDSFATNAVIDVILRKPMPELMALYANGHDMTDPLISPVFADYSLGFPPTLITSGTRDLLLSSAVMLHRQMRRGGVTAELHVWDAMTHAPFFDSPEEEELMNETVGFMLRALGKN